MGRSHDATEYLQRQLWVIEHAWMAERKYEASLRAMFRDEQDNIRARESDVGRLLGILYMYSAHPHPTRIHIHTHMTCGTLTKYETLAQ